MHFTSFVFAIIYFVFNNHVECRDKSNDLKDVFVSAFTPMGENGRVNLTAIPAYARYLKDIRVDGVLLSSIGGEGPNLNVAEKKSLYQAWMMFANNYNLQIITQIGGTSLPDILELARYSEELHVDAIVVLPLSYYLPTTVERLTRFLEVISEAAPTLPLIFFLHPDIVADIYIPELFTLASSRIPQFKGIFTDLETAIQVDMACKLRSDQKIYIFDYDLTSAAVLYGFDSFMEYEINICPELTMEIITQTKRGNIERASNAQRQLTSLINDLTAGCDRVSALKVATELVSGIQLGDPRLPSPVLSEDEREYVAKVLRNHDISLARRN